MLKLKHSQVSQVKRAILEQRQGGKCALCERTLIHKLGDACLDHDHVTGQVRGVLCRACNGVEGKIKNLFARWLRGLSGSGAATWLANLVKYWDQYSSANNPNRFLYPTHLDADEKAEKQRIKRNTAARKKRAASKARAQK